MQKSEAFEERYFLWTTQHLVLHLPNLYHRKGFLYDRKPSHFSYHTSLNEDLDIQFQRRLQAKGSSLAHKTLNKPSGHPGVESFALPIPDDYSRPWDLTPSKEGLILVIEVHWPPKCFVHVFKSHKFHIENQLLSCLNPANLTQIIFFFLWQAFN